MQLERFLERNRLPALENSEFATGLADIVHATEYALFGSAGKPLQPASFQQLTRLAPDAIHPLIGIGDDPLSRAPIQRMR
jgi:hypothetical protein